MEEILSKPTIGWRRSGLATLATTALVAGACVAGAGAASADADFTFQRIAGADRYETSALVAEEYNTDLTEAILANGEPGNYADALTANYLSGVADAPILLTKSDKIPADVKQQLEDAGVDKVWVVGGKSAVSDSEIASLRDAGYEVERISGTDRFETNADVIAAGGDADSDLGLVSTGFNFPDALAGGPLAYDGHPMALTTKDDIDDDVLAALKDAGVNKVLILGGKAAVSQDVVDELEAAGVAVVLTPGASEDEVVAAIAAALEQGGVS